MCGLQAITIRCPHQSRASRRVHKRGGPQVTQAVIASQGSSVILRAWPMHPTAGSLMRARGFARIVFTRARWNPAAGPSFCYASYPAAIPDSPNIRGCRCFPAPDTGKIPSMWIVLDILPALKGREARTGNIEGSSSHTETGPRSPALTFLNTRSPKKGRTPSRMPSHENDPTLLLRLLWLRWNRGVGRRLGGDRCHAR
jgi:hypothetical protein